MLSGFTSFDGDTKYLRLNMSDGKTITVSDDAEIGVVEWLESQGWSIVS